MNPSKLALAILLLASAAFSQAVDSVCYRECIAEENPEDRCIRRCQIVPGQGNPLQLFSYELKGPAPVIDGSLMSRNGDPSSQDALDEWAMAASRTLMLSDSTPVQLFLVNSPDTLYVGITYEHGNNSDGTGIEILFDEGDGGPGALDRTTDLRLGSGSGHCNEQGISIRKSGGSEGLVKDLCFKDTAWREDGDGERDFRAARYYHNGSRKVHHYEFAVPLNNAKVDDSANSDLDVLPTDAIGFFVRVFKSGAGAGVFHWKATNGNPNRADLAPYWGKIQLTIKREFFTFYTGTSPGPSPVVDGRLDEPVWNGAYQRRLILSNFNYEALKADFFALEDSANDHIYIGARIYDNAPHPGDFCQIYQEENGTNTTDSIRDYKLDNNAENSLRADSGGFSDHFWNSGMARWTPDTEAADTQAGAIRHAGAYTECEFKVLRRGGAQDIDIPTGGFMGFHLRYRDGNRPAERNDFYWEYSTNNDAQLLSQHGNPHYYLATGWANLQLGGPFIEVRSPRAGVVLTNDTAMVEVYIAHLNPASVLFFGGRDSTRQTMMSSVGGGVWRGVWNLAGYTKGDENLVVRVRTSSGLVYERVVWLAVGHFSGINPFASGARRLRLEGLGRDALVIGLERKSEVRLQLWDLSGRALWSRNLQLGAGAHRVTWPAGDFGNGVYYMALVRGQERIVRRIAVTR